MKNQSDNIFFGFRKKKYYFKPTRYKHFKIDGCGYKNRFSGKFITFQFKKNKSRTF